MKYNYQNIAISKDFYKSGEGFSKCLERLDPSEQYRGTELAGYDAFQRQLKRFDIKVSGQDSDRLQKFFATSDSAALFPEYAARTIPARCYQGMTSTLFCFRCAAKIPLFPVSPVCRWCKPPSLFLHCTTKTVSSLRQWFTLPSAPPRCSPVMLTVRSRCCKTSTPPCATRSV